MWSPNNDEYVPEPTVDAVPETPERTSLLRSRKLQFAVVCLIAVGVSGFYYVAQTAEPDRGPEIAVIQPQQLQVREVQPPPPLQIDAQALQVQMELLDRAIADADAADARRLAAVQNLPALRVQEEVVFVQKRDWVRLLRIGSLLLIGAIIIAVALYDNRFRPASE